MQYTYKVRLYPTKAQEELIQKTFGCCRFVYNYFLKKKQEAYEKDGTNLGCYQCCQMLTELRNRKEYEWLREVENHTLQQTLRNLEKAYLAFFRGLKKSSGKRNRFPKPKKKGKCKNSFRTPYSCGNIRIEDSFITLPKLGSVKFKSTREIMGKIMNVSVKQLNSGKYYAYICCKVENKSSFEKMGDSVGIDVGVKSLVTLSNGEKIDNFSDFNKLNKRLNRAQRRLSRTQRNSKRHEKARIAVAKIYEKISNKRRDLYDKLSLDIVKKYDTIAVENLDIMGMLISKKSSKKLFSDSAWGVFFIKLEYKAKWYGKNFVKINRFYPSSQVCSSCGYKNKNLKNTKIREWTCPECGEVHDRDVNAAKNILKEGLKLLQKK